MRSMPQRGFNRRIKLSSSRVVNVWELRRVVHNRIPRVVFDCLDGGAKAEITLREKNCHAFESVMFRHGRP
jgi:hypothetical protein